MVCNRCLGLLYLYGFSSTNNTWTLQSKLTIEFNSSIVDGNHSIDVTRNFVVLGNPSVDNVTGTYLLQPAFIDVVCLNML